MDDRNPVFRPTLPGSPFQIRLEHGAVDMSPRDALAFLVRHSQRMDISVACEVNGVEVIVWPDTSIPALQRAWDERGSKRVVCER